MSKPVKELLRKELSRKLQGVTALAVVELTGIDAVTTHRIRSRLREKNVRVSVVKNAVARRAFQDVGLSRAVSMLEGPCAVVYGADSVVAIVRTLLEIKKDAPNLSVKAALLEGEVFGKDRIEELSKYPTREEAIAKVLGNLLSPGGRLVACLLGPGAVLGSLVKAVQEEQEKQEKQERPGGEPAAA